MRFLTSTSVRGRLLFMLAAFVFSSAGQSYAQGTRSAPVDYSAVPKLEEMKGHPAAPDFTLHNPQGKKLSLKDYRGKLVLLNFWATWCAFCKEEMPGMERLYREFRDKGFEILAVNVKDKRNDALAFVKELKLSYTIMMDPAGEVGLLYGAWGMPMTYLIDEKGMVLARMWGPADWYSPGARNLIKGLLERKRPS
jgi:DsbE subfamily thiol:disulfide oxidoreductase